MSRLLLPAEIPSVLMRRWRPAAASHEQALLWRFCLNGFFMKSSLTKLFWSRKSLSACWESKQSDSFLPPGDRNPFFPVWYSGRDVSRLGFNRFICWAKLTSSSRCWPLTLWAHLTHLVQVLKRHVCVRGCVCRCVSVCVGVCVCRDWSPFSCSRKEEESLHKADLFTFKSFWIFDFRKHFQEWK